jgi:serine/threonine-protein kinase
MDPLIGQTLGQYEIISTLGAGGMATVYRARQKSMDRYVAVKVIKQDLVGTKDFLARFEREARTVANLSHPHILKVFDFGNQGNTLYLVMELLDGGSLSKFIAVNGPVEPATTVRLFDQIGQALDYAHAQNIIHRDLKPENVLLDKSQNAFLTDFGIAKLLDDSGSALTQTGIMMGTPAYMAPELWDAQLADARSDLYALGIMLYHMITGTLPFMGTTPMRIMMLHVNAQVPPPSAVKATISPQVDAVVRKALSKNPAERFQSAHELVSAYQRAVTSPAMSFPTPPNLKRTPLSSPTPRMSPVVDGDPDMTDRLRLRAGTPAGNEQKPTLPRGLRRPGRVASLLLGVVGLIGIIGVLLAVVYLNNQASATATAEFMAVLAQAGTATADALDAMQQAATRSAQTSAASTGAASTSAAGTASASTLVAQTVTDQAAASADAAASQTAIAQFTDTPTITATLTATATPTQTLDMVQVALLTEAARPTLTETATPTLTLPPPPTVTASVTASITPSATFTDTPTATNTATPSATPTPIPTETSTHTPTFTPSPDPAVIAAMTLAPLQTATRQAADLQATIAAILTSEARNREATETAIALSVQLTQAVQVATEAAQVRATLTQVAGDVQATQTAMARPIITATRPRQPGVPILATITVVCPGFQPSRLAVGMTGRVLPGDPNRLRNSPGFSGRFIGQMGEGRTFLVVDGPICLDGVAWWQVNYAGTLGWTSEGQGDTYFLEPVVTPSTEAVQCPGFLVSRLTIGQRARVTPGDNNSLNTLPARPSVNPYSKRIASIRAGESFLVLDGPVCGDDGYVWWKVSFNGLVGWTPEGRTGSPYWLEPIS